MLTDESAPPRGVVSTAFALKLPESPAQSLKTMKRSDIALSSIAWPTVW